MKATLSRKSRIRQGDIFKNLCLVDRITEKKGTLEIVQIEFPYAIILSQDCDLQWDSEARSTKNPKSHDKLLLSILAAPLYNAEHFWSGEQLLELGLRMRPITKFKKKSILTTEANSILNNNTPRYHYLDMPLESKIPNVIIDFKHYFSVSTKLLFDTRKDNFLCSISPIYRENISQRFANYLSRIGLPEIKCRKTTTGNIVPTTITDSQTI